MLMKFDSVCIFSLLLLGLSGCTTLEVPTGVTLSPEVSGRTVELGVSSQQSRVLYLAQDSDKNNTSITTRGGGAFRGGAIPGLYAALNFAEMISLVAEPAGYRLQVQLLGDNRQKAKAGNLSFSVFGGYSSMRVSENSTIELANPNKTLVSSPGSVNRPEFHIESQLAGAMLGLRTSDKMAIGIMYYKQKFITQAKGILRDNTGGSSVETPDVEINNEFIDTGYGLPIFLGGETFTFQFVPTYVLMKEPVMGKEVSYFLSNLKMSWTFP